MLEFVRPYVAIAIMIVFVFAVVGALVKLTPKTECFDKEYQRCLPFAPYAEIVERCTEAARKHCEVRKQLVEEEVRQ